MKDKIENGKFVAFTYRVTNAKDGSLLFEAKADAPDTYVHGVSDILPGLTVAMRGLSAGDKFSVTLPPAAHFGERNEENVMAQPIEVFQDEKGKLYDPVEVGAVLPMMTQDGHQVLGKVLSIGDKDITLDFNHPFAGLDIHFDGEVVEVRDATPEELAPQQGCGCGCGHDHCGEGDCNCEHDNCDCTDTCDCTKEDNCGCTKDTKSDCDCNPCDCTKEADHCGCQSK